LAIALDAVLRESTDIPGLHATHEADAVVWPSSNGRKAELLLHRGNRSSVRSIGFEAVSKRVEEAGCRKGSALPFFPVPQACRISTRTVWMRACDGHIKRSCRDVWLS